VWEGRICEMKTDGYMPVGRRAVAIPRDLAVQTAVQWLRGLVAGLSSRGGLIHVQSMWDLWWVKWQWDRCSVSPSVSTSWYHSTIAPSHSFIYHPRCIMFFSQHFSFPLSVAFHHCSILIHTVLKYCEKNIIQRGW
jgi:hypothetical protein